ncbi:MAG: glycine--tRNA ligase subunit beta [Gammaproteobacteria bacterium]|nr:MAG: glycine--tRNA ligase subunit beta [Gammaproteobacteria bacterium]
MTTILFELGSEELPPKNLKKLRDALTTSVAEQLATNDISYDTLKAFAAPRRLAIQIDGIADKQPNRVETKRGPAVTAAYDADGNPTKAATGFAMGLGIDVNELITINTKKGDYIGYELTIQGQKVADLLPAVFQQALDNLPIAKRMRSGASKDEFVRPVQWVVLMQDDTVINATIQGHQTGKQTRGHRFHAPDYVELTHANEYETVLDGLKVVADFDKRQKQIVEQVVNLAKEVNAVAIVPQELLDEVTALVDLPVALRASFEQRFLQVPQEALIKTMQADQKYFCLTDDAGKLLPYFVFISNIESKDPAQVIKGNEKVVRPRLADAEFFFLQDQKQPLIELTENLKTQVFQDQLGTIWDKSERMAKLATYVAQLLNKNGQAVTAEHAIRASHLAKADLSSHLVYEFPEMQGIAGTYYARLNGEPEAVAEAIQEQYLPKFSGDKLPKTPVGICLALADRIDTLVGIFGIGQAPTGSKDPFSLRRSAIGILRILIEKELPINLADLVAQAVANYGNKLTEGDTQAQVMAFINSRYRAMYTEQGVSVDTIHAVQAVNTQQPLDFDQRVRAVQAFRQLPQASKLAENNKRVANILAKAKSEVAMAINESLLQETAEKALYDVVNKAKKEVAPLQAQSDYQQIMKTLVSLDSPLTNFFDHVMVNVDDEALKNNRLALLKQVRELFLLVADIGELQN